MNEVSASLPLVARCKLITFTLPSLKTSLEKCHIRLSGLPESYFDTPFPKVLITELSSCLKIHCHKLGRFFSKGEMKKNKRARTLKKISFCISPPIFQLHISCLHQLRGENEKYAYIFECNEGSKKFKLSQINYSVINKNIDRI